MLEQEKNVKRGDMLLNFNVDGKTFALPISEVIEIIAMQDITYVPYLPDYVAGVTNVRGKAIPIIDLRKRLNAPVVDYTEKTCIITTESEKGTIGLIVDETTGVITVHKHNIVDRTDDSSKKIDFIKAIVKKRDNTILILDINKVIAMDNENQQTSEM